MRTIEVTSFGAAGDGIADDTASIAFAMLAAAESQATLHFPVGVYRVVPRTPFALTSGVSLAGDGAASVIRVADDSPAYSALFTQYGEVSGITLRGLTIDQNAAGNQREPSVAHAHYALSMSRFSNVLLDGVHFIGSHGSATVVLIGADIPHDATVRDCVFATTPAGDYDNSALLIHCREFAITGCTFVGSGVAYTAIESMRGPGRVLGNTITGYLSGIYAESAFYDTNNPERNAIEIANNTIDGCANGVIAWASDGRPMRGLRIAGNRISLRTGAGNAKAQFGKYGIGFSPQSWVTPVAAFDDVVLSGNVIDASDGYGIAAQPFANMTIDRLVYEGNVVACEQGKAIAFGGHTQITRCERNHEITPRPH